MSNINRRELLSGLALVPVGSLALLNGQDAAKQDSKSKSKKTNMQDKKDKTMQISYLEIVTPEGEAMCDLYAKIHGVKFGDPVPSFGNARTAKLEGGGMIGIRGPLRADEKPVTRTYMHVDDLKKAVAAAKAAGAEIAIESMELPGQGKIAIFIQGGIECGLWQT